MDPKIIETNKNVTIHTLLGGVLPSFTSNINVDFIPDVVIVKGILYSNGVSGTSPGGFMLSCDFLPQNGILGSFCENVFINSQSSFYLKKPINGTYTFKILDQSGALIVTGGSLFIHLDFIKYKEVKEGKVY